MKISLIVPVLNEEEAIPVFYRTVRSFPDFQGQDVEILFINDGSTDCTEAIIDKLSEKDELVKPISFTRHFGKEAGIMPTRNGAVRVRPHRSGHQTAGAKVRHCREDL